MKQKASFFNNPEGVSSTNDTAILADHDKKILTCVSVVLLKPTFLLPRYLFFFRVSQGASCGTALRYKELWDIPRAMFFFSISQPACYEIAAVFSLEDLSYLVQEYELDNDRSLSLA